MVYLSSRHPHPTRWRPGADLSRFDWYSERPRHRHSRLTDMTRTRGASSAPRTPTSSHRTPPNKGGSSREPRVVLDPPSNILQSRLHTTHTNPMPSICQICNKAVELIVNTALHNTTRPPSRPSRPAISSPFYHLDQESPPRHNSTAQNGRRRIQTDQQNPGHFRLQRLPRSPTVTTPQARRHPTAKSTSNPCTRPKPRQGKMAVSFTHTK